MTATDDLSQSEKDWLAKIKTDYRRAWWTKFFVNRREYDGPLPEGVEQGRRWNDAIHKIDEIHENTSWLGRFVANVFKSGAGEAEKKYPSRKK